jgi:hypothetical protein
MWCRSRSVENPPRLCQRVQRSRAQREAEKRSYEVGPVAGEEMEKLAKEVMAQPPAALERMKKVLGN